jgi:hypothetical protein
MAADQLKVTGRVVRFSMKHELSERSLEQWFLVGIDDDQKAMDVVCKRERLEDEVIEVVGVITPELASQWGLRQGEVRLVLPGEPIHN